jgi:putative flippase GtrA
VRLTLRLLPRAARFGMSGGVVALVNLGAMTVLVAGFDTRPEIALLASYALALAVHFTLNRQWVFSSGRGYHLHLTAQGTRYIGCAVTIYGVTALALATLPHALGVPVLAVYYTASLVLSIANFFVLRTFVFRAAG